jgi:hypothetical protein
MVRVFPVEFGLMMDIGLVREGVGVLGGECRDEIAGILGDEFGGADRGVVSGRLVYAVVNVHRVLFLRVDLDLKIVLELMFEGLLGTLIRGMLGSSSTVETACALAVGDRK